MHGPERQPARQSAAAPGRAGMADGAGSAVGRAPPRRVSRFGALAQEAGGIGPRAAFYAGYEAASGRAVQHDRVLWWELAATIRWAVVAADQAGRHLSGDTSLELALTGHIVPELEMDVLRMTGALDA